MAPCNSFTPLTAELYFTPSPFRAQTHLILVNRIIMTTVTLTQTDKQ